MKFKMNEKTKKILIEIFYVAVIAAVCFKLLHDISKVMDIQFADETAYLGRGIEFGWRSLFADGFVYYAWYKLLSLVVKDTVTLYYVNYSILFTLLPLLMYALLRKMGRAPFSAAFFPIAFAVSNIHIIAWPFITRFAVCLILLTCLLIFSIKSEKLKYVIAFSGLILLLYTRPEYVLSLVIFSIVVLIYLVYRFIKSRQKRYALLALITLLLSVFIVFIKNPAREERSVVAFGQHYALNLQQEGKISINPNTNWQRIMKDTFGTADSVEQAFMNNPRAMAEHILTNIKRLPRRIIEISLPYQTKNTFQVKITFLIFVGFLALAAIWGFIKNIRAQMQDRVYYIFTAVLLVPLIISICFIFPRDHYLLVLFAVVSVLAAKNLPASCCLRRPGTLSCKGSWTSQSFSLFTYVVLILILIAVPWRAGKNRGLLPHPVHGIKDKCSNLMKISFIKDLKRNDKIVFLAAGGSMKPYIDNFRHVPEYQKEAPFNTFLEQEKINMILIDNRLKRDTRFENDNEFKEFLAKVPNQTWTRMDMGKCRIYLLVKKDLLENE
jgi:hypothetical protein